MMSDDVWPIVALTLRTAALSTALVALPGVAVAWLLARREWRGKSLAETAVMLPLFLPPVATGLVLLMLFGRRGLLGAALERLFGVEIVFTSRAVVVACAVMSFPLFVRAAQEAFAAVPLRLEAMARTLGAGEWRVFWTISLPLARGGIVAGAVFAFARALGEFGATVVIAGMIPGETMTLALSIYQHVQLGQDAAALRLLGVSIAIVFAAAWCGQVLSRRGARK